MALLVFLGTDSPLKCGMFHVCMCVASRQDMCMNVSGVAIGASAFCQVFSKGKELGQLV